jgi:hypothetical protein
LTIFSAVIRSPSKLLFLIAYGVAIFVSILVIIISVSIVISAVVAIFVSDIGIASAVFVNSNTGVLSFPHIAYELFCEEKKKTRKKGRNARPSKTTGQTIAVEVEVSNRHEMKQSSKRDRQRQQRSPTRPNDLSNSSEGVFPEH